jgi:glycosyltransferase involved in cell wall biosynthesis
MKASMRVRQDAKNAFFRSRAMRILLVSEDIPYPQMGGLAKHTLSLARALIRAGHAVDLLGGNAHPIEAAGEEGEFGGRFFGELDGHDIGWKESKLGVFMPPRRTWVARRFAKIIMRRAAQYDVIHYHGHAPNLACFIPGHINFVQTRHDQGSDCLINTRFRDHAICRATAASACASCRVKNPNPVQTMVSAIAVNRYRSEVAKGFTRHKTIFVSDMLRQNFVRTMGNDPQHWGSVVHNFIDPSYIEQAKNRSSGKITGRTLQVFIAGKLYAPKGIEPFLHALADQLPKTMQLTIAGDGPDLERLRSRFASEQIRFLGWCSAEATLAAAASASVIVVPSIWEEPCSTSILEGLALGKPTFALANGGTPELTLYASFPNQLRLHPDMQSLVEDLIEFSPREDTATAPEILASADHAVSKLLDIYTQPPGSISGKEASPSFVIKQVKGAS